MDAPNSTSPASAPHFSGREERPQIPDHELIKIIGRGSYGEVWLARNVMGSFRAIKVIYRNAFDHERPYEREFEGIEKFEPISRRHESQLDILHVGRNTESFYYVMELADDASAGCEPNNTVLDAENYRPKTLKSVLDERKISISECIEIGLALATALAHLHKHGLVHRDIKPSNIVYVNGLPKLADIGLVCAFDATMSYVGTVGFVPPEGPGTPQADIYSLGKVLYEAATGRDRQAFPELPTQLSGNAEEQRGLLEFNEVLLRACESDPKDRYQSAEEMIQDLLLLQTGKSVRRVRLLEQRVQVFRKIIVAACIILPVAIAAYLYQARQTERVRGLAAENLKLAKEAQKSASQSQEQERLARQNLYGADIAQIQRALAGDNLQQARELLQKQIPAPGQPDLRGFEWRLLSKQCEGDELINLAGHKNSATCVGFSSDGRLLASGGADAVVKIWDATSGALLSTLPHSKRVHSVSFSQNGKWLATATYSEVSIWDARSFILLRTLPDAVFKAKFSPGDKYLLTCAPGGLLLWETSRWTVADTADTTPADSNLFAKMLGPEFGIAFSQDAKQIGIPERNGLRLLSIPEFKSVGFINELMPRFRFGSFSPDGRLIATSTASDGNVKLWDAQTKTEKMSINCHYDAVFTAAFSPDGKTFATCSPDQTVKIWDVGSGQRVRTLKGHIDEIWDVAFSPDGMKLASASNDGAVKIWSLTNHVAPRLEFRGIQPLTFSDQKIIGLTMNPQPHLVAIDLGSLRDPEDRPDLTLAANPGRYFLRDELTSDGRWVGFAAEKESISVFDLTENRFRSTLESEDGRVLFGGDCAATFTTRQSAIVWRLPHGDKLFEIPNAYPTAFSADGELFATRNFPGETNLTVWRISESRAVQVFSVHVPLEISGVARFSPDGKILAGAERGRIHLWEVPSGRLLKTLIGHKRWGTACAFSPDGRRLASLCDDRTMRIWDVETGRQLLEFQLPVTDVFWTELRFAPDGNSLVGATYKYEGFTSWVWRAPP